MGREEAFDEAKVLVRRAAARAENSQLTDAEIDGAAAKMVEAVYGKIKSRRYRAPFPGQREPGR